MALLKLSLSGAEVFTLSPDVLKQLLSLLGDFPLRWKVLLSVGVFSAVCSYGGCSYGGCKLIYLRLTGGLASSVVTGPLIVALDVKLLAVAVAVALLIVAFFGLLLSRE